MELRDVVRRRRMVRRFDPDGRRCPREVVARPRRLAVRAPSAGFSQGWDFVVLLDAGRPRRRSGTRPDAGDAPGRLAARRVGRPGRSCCACPTRTPTSTATPSPTRAGPTATPDRWPVPYWDTDTAMAAMLMLLGAEDAGLGALFFGVPGRAPRRACARRSASPPDRRLVGVVALGHEADAGVGVRRAPRRRRPLDEVLHVGRFGASATGAGIGRG